MKYAKSNGLTVTGGTRDGMEVQVKGPVSAVEKAFHVSMLNYQHPTEEPHLLRPGPRADDQHRAFAVACLRAGQLLDPASAVREEERLCRGARHRSPKTVVSHATTGSGPSASFLGSDMRAAYYGGTALTGAGQNLGLFEYYGTDLADLTTYYKNIGQTNKVPVTLISADGTSTSCVYNEAGGGATTASRTWT